MSTAAVRQVFHAAETTDSTTSNTFRLTGGWWKFSCDVASSGGWTVAIDHKEPVSGTIWRPVTKNGAAVSLTETEPAMLVLSTGEDFRAVVANKVSGAVSVWATPVLSNIPI